MFLIRIVAIFLTLIATVIIVDKLYASEKRHLYNSFGEGKSIIYKKNAEFGNVQKNSFNSGYLAAPIIEKYLKTDDFINRNVFTNYQTYFLFRQALVNSIKSNRQEWVTLTIHTNTEDVEIYINGEKIGIAEDASYEEDLPVGEYELKLQKKGYEPLEEMINLQEDTEEYFDLRRILKEVSFQSDPKNAVVIVDDRPVGYTPLTYNLPYGEHQITIQKNDRYVGRRQIVVTEAGQKSVNMELTRILQPTEEAELIYEQRKSLNNRLGYTGFAVTLGALGTSYYFQQEMNDHHDYYRSLGPSASAEEFDAAWAEVEDNRNYRNYTAAAAGVMALVGTYFLIRSPDYDNILENAQNERVSVDLGSSGSYAGINIQVNF